MSIHRANPRPKNSAAIAALLLALTGAASYTIAVPTPAHAATSVLQSESSVLSGGAKVENEHAGYTGTGYVGGYTDDNKGSAQSAYTVSSSFAGSGTVAVRYANGTGSAKTLTLTAGGSAQQIVLPATSG
ncbi:hypothetical protein E6P78_30040, partial [Streptomyces sp. A0958]